VCLESPLEVIVEHFVGKICYSADPEINHWLNEPWRQPNPPEGHHSVVTSRLFPKFDDVCVADGVSRYWQEYTDSIRVLVAEHGDRVRCVASINFTDTIQHTELLNWLGVSGAGGAQSVDAVILEAASKRIGKGYLELMPLGANEPSTCTVLVPYVSDIPESCEQSLRQIEQAGYGVRRFSMRGDPVAAMNMAVTDALEDGCLSTLWLTSNVQVDVRCIREVQSRTEPIVTIPTFDSMGPTAQFVEGNDPSLFYGDRTSVIQSHEGSLSFLFVRRFVYEKLAAKLPLVSGQGMQFVPFFVPRLEECEDGWRLLSMSQAFCRDAELAGFPVLVDNRIQAWLMDKYPYYWEDSARRDP
jgi:hypothetical protein